ncbi:MAG: hypothetical protein ACI8QZ_000443 [Chlamydiales bacterium]|jgi:hypothetical protein
MLILLPTLLVAAVQMGTTQEAHGTTLRDPASGATMTLPAGWSFARGEEGLMAVSEDRNGFILLAATEKNFDEVRVDVAALVLTRLDDVVIARTALVGADERGSLEALIAIDGTGTSRMDAAQVDFSAIVMKSGDAGVLALGAWKTAAHAQAVATILHGLHVEKSAGQSGLEMTDSITGASITFPEGWSVIAGRTGILANAPERGAMVMVMRWQDGFEQGLNETRDALLTHVFKDVTLGEFAVVEASYGENLGAVVAATGSAVDRMDQKPVDFRALRIQNVSEDRGTAIFGAWKSEQHAKQVQKVLDSITLKKLAPADGMTGQK